MDEYIDEIQEEDPEKLAVMQAVESLAESLLQKRDEAVEFRAASGIERQWREDEDAFDGMDETSTRTRMIDYVSGEAPVKSDSPNRSTVIINIIRGKCETAEGRFSDIQLPVDDKNWGLKPTPVPEIAKSLKDDRPASQNQQPIVKDGQPVKMSDVAKMDQDKIKEAMEAMESEIDDQLTECQYNAESRKVIRSAVRLGTGILKGPNVVKNLKKVFKKNEFGEWELQTEEDFQPASKWVSCWNVFPDPDCEEDIKRAAYIWEYQNILPRELRDLIGVDGYFDDQIIEILQEEPKRTKADWDDKQGKYEIQKTTASRGKMFERWDYYGDLDREDLEALGVDVSHDLITQTFSACVVFVNDRPIKVFLNALSTGEMPYDFFPWTSVSGSPWGIGIPRMLYWLQKVITAAWRATMDNAGDSAGANIILHPSVVPLDDIMEITGKKLWTWDNDELEDARKLFQQFQIQNTQPQLQAIIELALKFVDMETSLPMLFQGEKAEAPETLGATNIMVDANNVALRGRVKLYDDNITVPHLTRYYHYNMEHSKKDEIKGDYNVDARGTSVLLQKDQTAQTLKEVMAAKADPDFNLLVDWEKATKQMLTALRLDILKSPEDLENTKKQREKQPKKQDPRIEAANIKVQGDMKKAQLVNQSDMAEIQTKGQIENAELTFKAQEAERERAFKRQMKEMEMNMKAMELSQAQGISLGKIKSDLMRESMKIKTQLKLSGPDGKGPQVATPAVEPEGRAPNDMAFQA